MLWTEKYRPESFDGVVGNKSIVEEVEAEAKSGDISHMMFVGPAGVGKTTLAGIIADTLYEKGVESPMYKESNASDERGVGDIRNLKKFVGRSTLDNKHRLIFLDESDSLTPQAQQNLRRMMEDYSESCRFILSGNFKDKFIKPIQSRCTVYDFKRISSEECIKRLRYIVEEEDSDIEDETLQKLVEIYRGDLRGQINKLQSLHKSGGELKESEIDHIELYNLILQSNFVGARKKATVEQMRKLYYYMMDKEELSDPLKAELSIISAKYDSRINKSPDREIQLNGWLGETIKKIREYKK